MSNKLIGIASLILAIVSIIVAIANPEIREMLGLDSNDDEVKTFKIKEKDNLKTDNVEKEDNEETEDTVQKFPKTTKTEIQPNSTQIISVKPRKRRYLAVVGTFSDGNSANSMIQRCKRAGYEMDISWKSGKKQVGIVLYCTREELEGRLEKVQRQFNPQAWIDD